MEQWTLYLIECERDYRWYVGISAHPERRIAQHKAGHGAKATRRFGVKQHWLLQTFPSKALAMAAENALVRKLRREGKCAAGAAVSNFQLLTSWRFGKKGKAQRAASIERIQRSQALRAQELADAPRSQKIKRAMQLQWAEQERKWRREKEAYVTAGLA